MDFDILLDQLKDLTECGICTETFRDPRLLPCVHTFCFDCLKQLFCTVSTSDRKLVCPLCRSEFGFPHGGPETLPKNFFMKQLVEMAKNSKKTTREYLRSHSEQCNTGLPLSEPLLAPSGAKGPLTLCRKHELEELCLYCQDCRVVVCSRCLEEDHRRHRSSSLREIGDELRKRIQEDIEGLSICLNEVRRRRDELEKTKVDFLAAVDESEEAVNEQFARVRELIERERRSLIVELSTLKGSRLKEIETDREDLERHLVVLESCQRYLQDMRIKTSVSDICRSVDELNSKVQQLRMLHKTWMDHPLSLNPTPSFEATDLDNVMSSMNRNILGRIKVQHPGSLRLDSRLELENLSVRGVVGQNRKYYVISWNSDFIEVFREQKGTYLHLRRLQIPGLDSAQDVALCRKSGSLYVTDQGNACLWRVTLADQGVKRWLNNIDDPFTVSVTGEGDVVLLRNGPPPEMVVYNPDANLLGSTPLPVTRERAWHAVRKSTSGNYVISQGHVVYEMTPEGVELRRSVLDPSAQFLHLAVSEDDRIMAADYVNGRIILLDTELKLSEVLLDKTKNGMQWPCRLSYSKRKLLVVHKGIDIYTYTAHDVTDKNNS